MLIVALVLAVIGLAALVTAVVTSNELIAWVCIAASVIGVLLLIVDAVRERSRREPDGTAEPDEVGPESEFDADYPDEQDAPIEDYRDSDYRDSPTLDTDVTGASIAQSDFEQSDFEQSDEVAGEERNTR